MTYRIIVERADEVVAMIRSAEELPVIERRFQEASREVRHLRRELEKSVSQRATPPMSDPNEKASQHP